jgi:hypothetical protein
MMRRRSGIGITGRPAQDRTAGLPVSDGDGTTVTERKLNLALTSICHACPIATPSQCIGLVARALGTEPE